MRPSTATSTSRLADSVETALKLGGGVMRRRHRRRGRAPLLGAPLRAPSTDSPSASWRRATSPSTARTALARTAPASASRWRSTRSWSSPTRTSALAEGAIVPWARSAATSTWYFRMLEALAKKHGFRTRHARQGPDAGAAERRPLRRPSKRHGKLSRHRRTPPQAGTPSSRA